MDKQINNQQSTQEHQQQRDQQQRDQQRGDQQQRDQQQREQQQRAFLLQVSRQLETVLAACEQNGTAEVLIGSKRHSDQLLQVKLVAEKKPLTTQA